MSVSNVRGPLKNMVWMHSDDVVKILGEALHHAQWLSVRRKSQRRAFFLPQRGPEREGGALSGARSNARGRRRVRRLNGRLKDLQLASNAIAASLQGEVDALQRKLSDAESKLQRAESCDKAVGTDTVDDEVPKLHGKDHVAISATSTTERRLRRRRPQLVVERAADLAVDGADDVKLRRRISPCVRRGPGTGQAGPSDETLRRRVAAKRRHRQIQVARDAKYFNELILLHGGSDENELHLDFVRRWSTPPFFGS